MQCHRNGTLNRERQVIVAIERIELNIQHFFDLVISP